MASKAWALIPGNDDEDDECVPTLHGLCTAPPTPLCPRVSLGPPFVGANGGVSAPVVARIAPIGPSYPAPVIREIPACVVCS